MIFCQLKIPKLDYLHANTDGVEAHCVQDVFKTNGSPPLAPPVNGFEQDLETYLGVQLQALKSIAMIMDAIGPDDWIYPGHGRPCLKSKSSKHVSLLC